MRPARHAYGSDPAQFGELSVPRGLSRGTVVIVHGGFWRARYGLALGRPLAVDLVARDYTVWNVEYRRVGNGGGWPNTLADVAAAIDHLAELDVDTDRVVAIGHSAGGHLVTWAAGRPGLPDGSVGAAPRVSLSAAISQAGVLNLVEAAQNGVGGTAVIDLLGGTPERVPARYAIADPSQAIPLDVPVVCVHALADANVPYSQSAGYVAAASQAGAQASLVTVQGDHFTLIDPSTPDWAAVVDALTALTTR